jgi:hypothetical protein
MKRVINFLIGGLTSGECTVVCTETHRGPDEAGYRSNGNCAFRNDQAGVEST